MYDTVIIIVSFLFAGFCGIASYLALRYCKNNDLYWSKELETLRAENKRLNLLYQSSPIVKAKPQQLDVFKSVPRVNGNLTYRTIGGKTYSAKESELLLYNANEHNVKIIRQYWQLNKHNKWVKTDSEELIVKETEVNTNFVYTDTYTGFSDKIVNIWQLVK